MVPGPPHLISAPPHFMFGSPIAAYIQYCILKMWTPLVVFGPPLLQNPGDGPGCRECKRAPKSFDLVKTRGKFLNM